MTKRSMGGRRDVGAAVVPPGAEKMGWHGVLSRKGPSLSKA